MYWKRDSFYYYKSLILFWRVGTSIFSSPNSSLIFLWEGMLFFSVEKLLFLYFRVSISCFCWEIIKDFSFNLFWHCFSSTKISMFFMVLLVFLSPNKYDSSLALICCSSNSESTLTLVLSYSEVIISKWSAYSSSLFFF